MFIALALVIYCVANAAADIDIVRQFNLGILLFSQQNPDTAIPLQTANLSAINITVTKQLKTITHGWNDNSSSAWVTEMKDAYILQGHTVIFVDWSYYSTNLDYPLVISFVPYVGNIIGKFILDTLNIFGIELSAVECIGHSLGAHVCGFAGKYIKGFNKTIGNITGLDPAGPGYEDEPPEFRLNATDADVTKVIHSNAGTEGIIKTIGKVDFFPNGGIVQPGCLPGDTNCSHFKAIDYWTTGIYSNQYVAAKCLSYMLYQLNVCDKETAVMGEGMDAGTSGVFFLKT